MASYVFDNAKLLLGTGQLKFDGGGPYRLALMVDALKDEAQYSGAKLWGEIKQFEISNPQYTPAPVNYESKEIMSVGITPSGDNYIVHGGDVKYPVATISASYIVIVKGSNSFGNTMYDQDLLIEAIDIRGANGLPAMSNNGVFSIKLGLSSCGFLIIK